MNGSLSSPEFTPDKKERIAAKIVLLQRGLNYRDLAKRTGRSLNSIANLLCGNDPYWPGRAAVNKALGVRIFSKANLPDTTRARKAAAKSRAARKIRKQRTPGRALA